MKLNIARFHCEWRTLTPKEAGERICRRKERATRLQVAAWEETELRLKISDTTLHNALMCINFLLPPFTDSELAPNAFETSMFISPQHS